MEENKINELEERELTDEESEKVAGGVPTLSRIGFRLAKKPKKTRRSPGRDA